MILAEKVEQQDDLFLSWPWEGPIWYPKQNCEFLPWSWDDHLWHPQQADGSGQNVHNPIAFHPADALVGYLNANTIPDLVSVNPGSNNVSVFIDNGTPGVFQLPTVYPAGTRPVKGVLAHFDSDTIPDLVVVNSFPHPAPGTLSILRGQLTAEGIFSFASPPTIVPLHLSVSLAGRIVAGFFDTDTLRDVAIISPTAGTVSVLLNNGIGSFGSPTNIVLSPPSTPLGIATAHLNNIDTHVDLAISDLQGRIHVLLGNGAGGFAYGSVTAPLPGGFLDSIACGDVNNDGNVDCVVTQRGMARICVFYGTGTGALTQGPFYAVSPYPSLVALSDLNGDGNLDCFVTSYWFRYDVNGRGTIYMGDGSGSFALHHTFTPLVPAPLPPGSVRTPFELPPGALASNPCADMNGDGVIDIVVAGYDWKAIVTYRGLGNGTFDGGVRHSIGEYPVTTAAGFQVMDFALGLPWYIPSGLAFDSTGNLYVASGSGGISWFWNIVSKVSPTGEITAFGNRLLIDPEDVTIGWGGNAYYSCRDGVWQITPAGAVSIFAKDPANVATHLPRTGEFMNVDAIVFDPTTNLLYAGAQGAPTPRVYAINNLTAFPGVNYSLLTTLLPEKPDDIALNPAGGLYVGQRGSIIRVSYTGVIDPIPVATGLGGYSYFDVHPTTGEIYFGRLGTVAKFTPIPGATVSTFTTVASGFANVTGIAFDAAGRLYVLDGTWRAIFRIAPANLPPVLSPIGAQVGDELTLISFTATATDPDSPVLTFSLGPTAPAGASITPVGYFTWTPTEAQGPGVYTVRVIVSDGVLTDYEDVQITVNEVNIPPTIAPIPLPQVLVPNQPYSLQIHATDPDIPANLLTYSAANLPPGFTISPTGLISGTAAATYPPPGVFNVQVTVSDGQTGVAVASFPLASLSVRRTFPPIAPGHAVWIEVRFSQITVAGDTTIEQVPAAAANLQLRRLAAKIYVNYLIQTTAQYTGPVTITKYYRPLLWPPVGVTPPPDGIKPGHIPKLRLYHRPPSGMFTEVPTTYNMDAHVITGSVNVLSEFVLGVPVLWFDFDAPNEARVGEYISIPIRAETEAPPVVKYLVLDNEGRVLAESSAPVPGFFAPSRLLGTSTLIVRVEDSASNYAEGDFSLTVKPPTAGSLAGTISVLSAKGHFKNKGIETALRQRTISIGGSIASGQTTAARQKIDAILKFVENQVQTGNIAQGAGTVLVDGFASLRTTLVE